MNERLLQLYDYHAWANERIIQHLKTLPDEVFFKEVDAGFKSIAEVIGHLMSAEEVWLARMQEKIPPALEIKRFSNLEEAHRSFRQLQSQFREFLLSIRDFEKKVTYRNSTGQEFQNSLSEIIQHLVNHGTYHRGNVATMMRCLGYKGIQTDYIAYLRI